MVGTIQTERKNLMNNLRKPTGFLLVLTPVAFMLFFTLLQMTFEYPDILRKPTGYTLQEFAKGGGALIALWYGLMFTSILFVPLVVMVHSVLAREETGYLKVTTVIGILAGVVQFMGLIRWTFLVPYLALTYLDPATSSATRDAVVVVFQTFNQYAGVGIGEHLGYLFTSVWSVGVALALHQSRLFKTWMSWLGLVSAAGIFAGIFEPLGFGIAGAINAMSYILWAIWLIAMGVALLRPAHQSANVKRSARPGFG
jgi:hypothetical protein